MAGEWKELSFTDAFEVNPLTRLTKGVGYPFVEMAAIASGTRDVSAIESRPYTGGGSRFASGDTLMARITPCLENGKIARFVGLDGGPAHGSTEFIVVRGRDGISDSAFAYYVTTSPEVRRYAIGKMTGTSGRQRVPTDALNYLSVALPPVDEQRAIAHILGTLDDKIELNRRRNATLEAMARALFKAWFVDFEPVRAKLEGRARQDGARSGQPRKPLDVASDLPRPGAKAGAGADGWHRGQSLPGLPAHLYDLFPDRLADSDLGEIPEGWQVMSLDEIATFLNGLALQKYPPQGDSWLPVIKIAQLHAGDTTGADHASAELESAYVVADGDILFSWSGSLECVLWAGGPGALNQHLFKVMPKGCPRWLCYFAIHHHLPSFRAIAAGKATTMGHIQRHHLSDAKIAMPPATMLAEMDRLIAPLFESLWKRALESRTLATLRDTLLPKLISGELRVPEAGD